MHDPVVNVWPQKWWASASPGSISFATVPAAAPATSAPPIRARNPLREVSAARPSSASPIRPPSGDPLSNRRARVLSRPPPLGRRQHALQLGEVVERALGQHDAGTVQCDRERAARDGQLPPDVRVSDLVEDLD